jgi:hypothetical protein
MPHPERITDHIQGLPDGLDFFISMAAWQPRSSSTVGVPNR